MDLLMDTVKNLAMYLIFITVIKNLIGDTSYGKYAEFFMGIVMILILLGPLSKALKMDGTLDSFLNFEQFNINIQDAKYELQDGDDTVNSAILLNAQDQINLQIEDLAKKEGVFVENSKVTFSEEEEDFGSIKKMELWLSYEEKSIKINKVVLSNKEETSDKFSSLEKKIMEIFKLESDCIFVYEA